MDFINDNVGKELLFDLALADFLLRRGWAGQVTFHLKDHPFFVSDAMPADVQNTIDGLYHAPTAEAQMLALRLAEYRASGSFTLVEHPFWAGCLMFRQMPEALRQDLAGADLVILKGDLNYRRLLDDRHWPSTTSMESVTAYFPTSFVSLRTLKGEIMVGLEPGQAESLQLADPTWLINGKRGVIHLVEK